MSLALFFPIGNGLFPVPCPLISVCFDRQVPSLAQWALAQWALAQWARQCLAPAFQLLNRVEPKTPFPAIAPKGLGFVMKNAVTLTLLLMGICFFGSPFATADEFSSSINVTFTSEGWNASDWFVTKSARFPKIGKWNQDIDHIWNAIPTDATEDEMISKRAAETHAALVWRRPIVGKFEAKCKMSFDHRMAPAIILASELNPLTDQTVEYRDHIQIVLFDQGINVWGGKWDDEKFNWTKLAYHRFSLEPKKIYELAVARDAKSLVVRIDGQHEFGFAIETPDSVNVGIIGCEGINRFYDFSLVSETNN